VGLSTGAGSPAGTLAAAVGTASAAGAPEFHWRQLDLFRTSTSLPPALAGHAGDMWGGRLVALGGPCVGGVVEDDHNIHLFDMVTETYEVC